MPLAGRERPAAVTRSRQAQADAKFEEENDSGEDFGPAQLAIL